MSTTALAYLNSHGGATGAAYTTIWDQSGNYDSIRLTNGTFNLGVTGAGTVEVIDNSSSLTLGSIFKLLDWSTAGTTDSLAGSGGFTLADLNLIGVSPGSGLAWDTSAFTTYGVIVVVPSPPASSFSCSASPPSCSAAAAKYPDQQGGGIRDNSRVFEQPQNDSPLPTDDVPGRGRLWGKAGRGATLLAKRTRPSSLFVL